MHSIERARELLAADLLARNADPLRGFRSDAAKCRARCANRPPAIPLDHGRRGAFAVGAGDVDEPAGAMRIPERLQEFQDALKSQLRSLNLVTQRVKELNRLGIGHAIDLLPPMNTARPRHAISTQPPSTFSSKIFQETTSGGGTAESTMAAAEMLRPRPAASFWPYFQPTAKYVEVRQKGSDHGHVHQDLIRGRHCFSGLGGRQQ